MGPSSPQDYLTKDGPIRYREMVLTVVPARRAKDSRAKAAPFYYLPLKP